MVIEHLLVQTIPNRKQVRQILTYPDSAIPFRHIFIGLTSFIWIPNSMRILHKTSLLTES